MLVRSMKNKVGTASVPMTIGAHSGVAGAAASASMSERTEFIATSSSSSNAPIADRRPLARYVPGRPPTSG
jgi:hypothetical protein